MKAAIVATSDSELPGAWKRARALGFEEGPVVPSVRALDECPHRADVRMVVVAAALPEGDLERLLREGLTVALDGRPIDPTTPEGQAFAAGLHYSKTARIRAGVAAHRAEERSWGRPSRFAVEDAAKAVDLRKQGMSWTRLARALGVPRTTARRLAGRR